MPALLLDGRLKTCSSVAQAGGNDGPPRGPAIPNIATFRNLSQPIAPACGSSGSPGSRQAVPSRVRVYWKCIATSAEVGHREGECWCGRLARSHDMDAAPHRQ